MLVASGFSVVPVPSFTWKNEFDLSGGGSTKVSVFLKLYYNVSSPSSWLNHPFRKSCLQILLEILMTDEHNSCALAGNALPLYIIPCYHALHCMPSYEILVQCQVFLTGFLVIMAVCKF